MAHLDYGLASSGRVCALIGPDTSIDWLCMPRFDGPSVFAALLDPAKGGRCAVRYRGANPQMQTRYLPDSNVLETTMSGAAGVLTVTDFCPVGAAALVRLVRPVRGSPSVDIELTPRWDYGRDPDGPGPVTIQTSRPVEEPIRLDAPLVLVISHGPASIAAQPAAAEAALRASLASDRAFVATLTGATCEMVRRSALVLHALTDETGGGLIAAATTSVPEALGEPRNWDYRYVWIRDACFAAEALLRLGHRRTASRLLDFFRRVGTKPDGTLQPLFGIDGRAALPEMTLDNLDGFGGSRPVRIGNAAALQHQHDAYGQLIWLTERLGGELTERTWAWVCGLVDTAISLRALPDAGIWEFRDRPGRYTTSRAWIWVALHRGARLARRAGDVGRAQRWRELAAEEHGLILECARRTGFFAQTLDCDNADAASLVLPALGLVDATDPLFLATMERCEAALETGGMMRRYVARDDFGDTTSVFNLCTLWWVEALARAGHRDRARRIFDAFMGHANPLGLLSEDVDPSTGRLLGNFPQAYSHTGVINAALALGEAGGSPPAEESCIET